VPPDPTVSVSVVQLTQYELLNSRAPAVESEVGAEMVATVLMLAKALMSTSKVWLGSADETAESWME